MARCLRRLISSIISIIFLSNLVHSELSSSIHNEIKVAANTIPSKDDTSGIPDQNESAKIHTATHQIIKPLLSNLVSNPPLIEESPSQSKSESETEFQFESLSEPSLTTTWERCTTHQTCHSCTTSSWGCHWCSHDNACHAKGSLEGCSIGATCPPNDEDDHPPDSQNCFDHTTCADCAASSWGCHWCAHDEACHAIGSVHGCASGVNCYAIDRCQRLEPEEIHDGGVFSKSTFTGVGPVVKIVLGILVGLVLCCSTICLVGATAVKCAVDDLVGEPDMVEDGVLVAGRSMGMGQGGSGGVLREEEEERDELEIALLRPPSDGTENIEDGHEEIQLKNDSNLMTGEQASMSQITRMSATTSARRQPKGESIRRMFFACQLCYLITFLTTGILAIVSMSYAPRQPQYNVCTDQLAWKSIVEGMASLKMSASFDLLISVYNPNRFEVDLDNGSGQFHHDGEYVGSFSIPSAKISAKAISDMVVKVSFTPDKWSALSLTSEYYRGTLKFMVGGHTHVKIPGLGNYQFDAKFDDILVNVNDPALDDTHLCACPEHKKPGDGELL